jgi:hypothetical protein
VRRRGRAARLAHQQFDGAVPDPARVDREPDEIGGLLCSTEDERSHRPLAADRQQHGALS